MTAGASVQVEEIRSAGRSIFVPSVIISGQTVVVTGRWIRKAQIKDEELVEGRAVHDPESLIRQLKDSRLRADFFTFAQRPPEITPNYNYHLDWENWAVTPTTCFKDWWENRLPQETRKNVRRAAKRGVVVRIVPFDDDLVNGIYKIYNETPIRGGRPCWHYGKNIETVRRGLLTYLKRSDFLGAYWRQELIGFIKLVYIDDTATLIHIISMNAHNDKRPMNALIAKAVELCEQKGIARLVYGQMVYGRKRQSAFLEFKRRNGFEQVNFPRYYLPLSLKGKSFVGLRLYKGVGAFVPEGVLAPLLKFRSWYYEATLSKRNRQANRSVAFANHQTGSLKISK